MACRSGNCTHKKVKRLTLPFCGNNFPDSQNSIFFFLRSGSISPSIPLSFICGIRTKEKKIKEFCETRTREATNFWHLGNHKRTIRDAPEIGVLVKEKSFISSFFLPGQAPKALHGQVKKKEKKED